MSQARDDFPYEGEAGQTRLEPVHLPTPDGEILSVPVYRGINLATDPELLTPLLSGDLHRFEGGAPLSLSLVLHDPTARRFILYVPDELRHQVLRERARLLEALAEDTGHPIPLYVRHFTVSVGARGLERELSRSAVPGSQDLRGRGKRLDEREQRLREGESALSSRERALDAREAALRSREDEQARALSARERGKGHDVQGASGNPELSDAAVPQEVTDDELEDLSLSTPDTIAPPPKAENAENAEFDLLSEVEMLDEEGAGDSEAPGLADMVDGGAVEALPDAEEPTSLSSLEAVAPPRESTEEIEIVEGPGSTIKEIRRASAAPPRSLPPATPRETPPPVPPPAEFLEDRYQQMMASLEGDDVWLFARVEEGHEEAFAPGDADLLIQLSIVEDHPVVLLALVDSSEKRPYVRRATLDPLRQEHLAVLKALEKDFRAKVALFGGRADHFQRELEVRAPRGGNVSVVLARAERQSDRAGLDSTTAMERALAVPPPIRGFDHPFQARAVPEDPQLVMEEVRALAKWATPERLDQVLLGLSVPREIVTATFERVFQAALRYGIALSAELVSRAVAMGMVREPGELIAKQLEAFGATVSREDKGGLDKKSIADNFRAILDAAEEHEVTLDAETQEVAWQAIREAEGPDSIPPTDFDESRLRDMGIPELVLLLEHPRMRARAAVELCGRGDPEVLATVYRNLRKMPREDVLSVLPHVLVFGEGAGDALIDGLAARKTFVRQASAVALGHLRLRRAIAPLTRLLEGEPSEVWQEVARALSLFGSAGLRALARSLADPAAPGDRFAYALAHMAERGLVDEVEALKGDGDSRVAGIVNDSSALREAARAHWDVVEGTGTPSEGDVIRHFSKELFRRMNEGVHAGQGA